jgi:hypothetical protein
MADRRAGFAANYEKSVQFLLARTFLLAKISSSALFRQFFLVKLNKIRRKPQFCFRFF